MKTMGDSGKGKMGRAAKPGPSGFAAKGGGGVAKGGGGGKGFSAKGGPAAVAAGPTTPFGNGVPALRNRTPKTK